MSDERIVHDWLDGSADSAELRAWLTAEAEHVDELVRWSDLHWRLHEAMTDRRTRAGVTGVTGVVGAAAELAAVAGRIGPIGVARKKRWGLIAAWATIAAAVGVGGLIAVYVSGGGGAPTTPGERRGERPVVAVLGLADGVDWHGEPMDEGADLATQAVSINAGRVEVDFRGGATVTLIGPATMTLRSASRVELERGRVEVDVGESGAGFTVDAPHGVRVVDLGTRFAVTADDRGVDVSVVEGRVELYVGDQLVELATGESRLVTADGAVLGGFDRLMRDASVVALYRFDAADEAAGRVVNAAATDTSLDGAIVPGAAEQPGEPTTTERAMRFTGIDGPVVRVRHDERLNLLHGGTIAMRLRLDDPAQIAHLVNKIDPATQKPGFNLAWTGGAQPRVYLHVGERGVVSEPVTPPTGWFDLAVTWKAGGEAVFYIDGVRVSSAPVVGALGVNESDLLIGRASWTDDGRLAGEVERMAVFARSLGANEIAEIAAADFGTLEAAAALRHGNREREEP